METAPAGTFLPLAVRFFSGSSRFFSFEKKDTKNKYYQSLLYEKELGILKVKDK